MGPNEQNNQEREASSLDQFSLFYHKGTRVKEMSQRETTLLHFSANYALKAHMLSLRAVIGHFSDQVSGLRGWRTVSEEEP